MMDGFPAGESCFIDANMLACGSIELTPLPVTCRAFLERVAGGEIFAFTSVGAVTDALFKSMVVEVTRRFLPPGIRASAFPQEHPEVIGEL